MSDQLEQLAKPFPQSLIERKPGKAGGDYVKHSVVAEKLLATVGPYDFRVVREIRDADTSQIVGVIGELTCTIDGRVTTIAEAGDCDNPGNWPHDGARVKNAASDAFKRCAMRLGCGLHLWSQDAYRLPRALAKDGTP